MFLDDKISLFLLIGNVFILSFFPVWRSKVLLAAKVRPPVEPGCPGQHGQDIKFIPFSWVGQASSKASVGQKSEAGIRF